MKVFHDAMCTGNFECYLRPDTMLPMMYIDDCLNSVLQFMQFPAETLKQRTYNITAMSFTPEQLFDEIRTHIPNLKVTYKVDSRQKIGIKIIKKSNYVFNELTELNCKQQKQLIVGRWRSMTPMQEITGNGIQPLALSNNWLKKCSMN